MKYIASTFDGNVIVHRSKNKLREHIAEFFLNNIWSIMKA